MRSVLEWRGTGRDGSVIWSDSCVRLSGGTEPADSSGWNIPPRCGTDWFDQIGRTAENGSLILSSLSLILSSLSPLELRRRGAGGSGGTRGGGSGPGARSSARQAAARGSSAAAAGPGSRGARRRRRLGQARAGARPAAGRSKARRWRPAGRWRWRQPICPLSSLICARLVLICC